MSCTGWSASIQRAGAISAVNLSRMPQATMAAVARAGGLNLKKPVRKAEQSFQPLRRFVVADGFPRLIGFRREPLVKDSQRTGIAVAQPLIQHRQVCWPGPVRSHCRPVSSQAPCGLEKNPKITAAASTEPPSMPAIQSLARRRSGMVASLRRPEPSSASTSTARDLSDKPDYGKITLKTVEVFRRSCRAASLAVIA